jgi:hypothetical protein
MIVRTIASYTERNTNSKIGVQGAMLVGTNEMIIVSRLRMNPKCKKGEGERGGMSLLIRTLKATKSEKFPLKHMFSNPRDAELLLWHVNRKTDGKIRHPTDDR